MELLRDGSRRRRRNIAGDISGASNRPDVNDIGITVDDLINKESTIYKWISVGGNPDISLFVVQIAHKIIFFDASIQPVVSGFRSEIVDLSTYSSGSFTVPTAPATAKCQFATGKGKLFVVNPFIDPFFIRYDKKTDTLSEETIDIRIRDFDGLDDGLEVDERPDTLSNEHYYNLRNQGWLESSVTTDKAGSINSSDPVISFRQYVYQFGLD